MGLCKCPKKKVTNLFCFEHRCVVQSYLSWLADSDYDTSCALCAAPFECKETVRLKYLFHWECLDAWARRLPANTAPAGYKCQQCQDCIFPAPNQTSPTIERLRSMLQQANWARAGLGLSLLPEPLDHLHSPTSFTSSTTTAPFSEQQTCMSAEAVLHKANFSANTATVVDVENDYIKREQQNQFTSRKLTAVGDVGYVSANSMLLSRDRDEDLPENKYKRRSASEWFSRWFRSRYGRRSAFDVRARWKNGIFYVILCVVLVMTVFTVLSRVLTRPSEDDPSLDLLANPDIRIALPEHSQ
ncbi:unnamed protein product [Gongylonema pulchrum]|uniref:Zinc finger protein-like 1 homolog n=1 Tax=Gongylonema pulchrum TaxID=637853 RepID=A0A183DYQ3_9BILA|nr:unnamed protein product [Gongylonema pulchrum]